MIRRAGLLVAALLAGGAGLALETVLAAAAGPAMGQGRAAAWAIAIFVAGWGVGARLGGALASAPRRALAALALLSPAVAAGAAELAFLAARAGWGDAPALAVAALALALGAVPQGAFLPLLVQARDAGGPRAGRGVGALWGASLAGGLAGAWLVGHELAGAEGRLVAARAAGGLALVAGLVGAACARGAAADQRPAARAAGGDLAPGRAGLALAALTAWLVGVEWVQLRLAVLVLGSMEEALAIVLGSSLLALALGAWLLPPALPGGARGVAWLGLLGLLGTAWPVLGLPAVGADEAWSRGAARWALALPGLLAFGAAVPVLHRARARVEGERPGHALGALLGWEALGALLGAGLAHEVLVPRLGLAAGLGVLGAIALATLAVALAPRRAALGPALCAPLALLAAVPPPPARALLAAQRPEFAFVAFEEDGEFAVSVVDDGLQGERTLLTDRFRAAGTGPSYRYMRSLGHVPLLLHPRPRDVAVLALGTGTTLGAVARHPEVERLDVLELSPAVVRQAPHFRALHGGVLDEGLPGLLERSDGERERVVLGDGRRTLARGAPYDVITMEPLLPSSPFGVYLYTREFYARARAALAPDGLLCQWIPPHALAPATFEAVVAAATESFPWSGVWLCDAHVVVVGGERRPALDPGRFARADDVQGDALGAALAEVGLAEPAGLAARWVCDGDAWPRAARPLTDADPWVVFVAEPAAVEVLGWLPENLARLTERWAPDLPPAWADAVGADGVRRRAALRALLEARAARARHEAARLDPARGDADGLARRAEERLQRARELAPEDPGVEALASETAFVDALRAGARRIAAGSADAAVRALVGAVELRPERADAHLWLALALRRAGLADAARAAEERARELCPGLDRTDAARRARALAE